MTKLFATILEGSNKCALCGLTNETRLSPTSCQQRFRTDPCSLLATWASPGRKKTSLSRHVFSFRDSLSRIHDKRPMGRPAESHLSLSHMDTKIGTLPDQLMFTTSTGSCSLHSLWIPAARLLPRYSTCRYVFLDFQNELRWRRILENPRRSLHI